MEERIHRAGELVGSYEILEHLASGGFAAIYSARDLHALDEELPVALKVARYEATTVPKDRRLAYNERLGREFDLVAALDHRNVVRVFESGFDGGTAYYAMELLEGVTLSRWLAEKRRTFAEVLDVYEQLVNAVAYCHRQGVVHRDLKPSNVVVTKPERRFIVAENGRAPPTIRSSFEPVLVDFGTSQRLTERPVTAPGEWVGTAEYLSPQYARTLLAGECVVGAYRAEPHEDVYALSVLLYEVLTGALPTRTPAERLLELLREIRDGEPVDPWKLNPEMPPTFAALARRGLAKRWGRGVPGDQEKRPADAMELLVLVQQAREKDRALLGRFVPEYRAGIESAVRPERPTVVEAVDVQPPGEPCEGAACPGAVGLPEAGVASSGSGATAANDDAVAAPAPEGSLPEQGAKTLPATPTATERPAPREPSSRRGEGWMRPWRAFAVAAGVAFVALLAQNLHLVAVNLEMSRNSVRSAEASARSAEAARDAAKSYERLTSASQSPAPAASLMAGLPMPEKPNPRWMKSPCVRSDGQRMQGVRAMRGTCWEVGVNPDNWDEHGRIRPTGPTRPCPNGLYDPPSEVSSEDKRFCFYPVFAAQQPEKSVSPDSQ